MAFWANVLKFIQFASIVALTNWKAASELPYASLVACFSLIALGQHLNFLVYKLLGVDGVYYGSRFGKSLPWVTAYPYDTVRDPQYVGSMITILGCSFIAPAQIMIWWFANYLYLMWLESKIPDMLKASQ
jgi:methylene-fatty-acyl-phospholipid synthase